MNKKRKSKKGILRNALVFLFSVVFTVSAYAAPVYDYDTRTALEIIEQDTTAPTNETLNGTCWYTGNENSNTRIVMLSFLQDENFLSLRTVYANGDANSIMGDYELDGNKITVKYIGGIRNGKASLSRTPVYETHYIGLTDDGECLFSLDGKSYLKFKQLPNE